MAPWSVQEPGRREEEVATPMEELWEVMWETE
jgi:hypothetical protein